MDSILKQLSLAFATLILVVLFFNSAVSFGFDLECTTPQFSAEPICVGKVAYHCFDYYTGIADYRKCETVRVTKIQAGSYLTGGSGWTSARRSNIISNPKQKMDVTFDFVDYSLDYFGTMKECKAQCGENF
jgi:hypothetical protein